METSGPDMWGAWCFHPFCTRCDQLESKGRKGRGVVFFCFSSRCMKPVLSPAPQETEMLGSPGQSQGSCSLCRKKAGGILFSGLGEKQRAQKHEWMWGDTARCHKWRGHDNRCFTCRLSMQPQNLLEMRSEASVNSKSVLRGSRQR